MLSREEAIKRIEKLEGCVYYQLDNGDVVDSAPFPDRNPDDIDLEYADIDDECLKEILSAFTADGTFHLRLPITNITDKGLGYLAEMRLPIVSMDLSHTNITDACVGSLLQLEKLEFIEMEHTAVSQQAVNSLQEAGINIKPYIREEDS